MLIVNPTLNAAGTATERLAGETLHGRGEACVMKGRKTRGCNIRRGSIDVSRFLVTD